MMHRTHVTLGIAAGGMWAAAVAPFVPPAVALLCIPAAALGGPAPDMDHHAAPAHRVVMGGLWVAAAFAAVLQRWTLAVFAAFVLWRIATRLFRLRPTRVEQVWRDFFRHREGTHRIRTALAVGAVGAALTWLLGSPWVAANGWAVAGAFMAGWLSHIYGDARTHSGVPVFDREVTIGRTVRTGSTYASAHREGIDPHRTEEHLRLTRFRPAAWATNIAAVVVISGQWPVVAALLGPLWHTFVTRTAG